MKKISKKALKEKSENRLKSLNSPLRGDIGGFLIILFIFLSNPLSASETFGLKVTNNKIIYIPDEQGNRILDFSTCGYRGSDIEIPNVGNKIFVPHIQGDASDVIQRAINYISGLKPDKSGFRGAVLLDKGTFALQKSLRIAASGVVLRGSDKEKTILLKQGPDRGALLRIEGAYNQIITDSISLSAGYISVNQTKIQLTNAKNLKPGDRLKIIRPSSKEWIAAIGCDIFGGGISALGWKPGDTDIQWDRTILAVNGNEITLNAGLTTAIDPKYGGAKVLKYYWNGRIAESGVEHLTLVSDYDKRYPMDEDHCWTGISIENAENCWVRQVNFRHFAGNAVFLQPTASNITVEDCISLQPVSEKGGMRRVTFFTMGQLNLFQRCYSEEGIHDFSAGFAAPGPNAFVQCATRNSLGFSGAISSWAAGLLFDNVDIDGNNLSFKNLGQSKNGAGWSTANSLFWQCTAAEIECYSPSKDAQNRAYGCWAQYSGNGLWAESDNHVQPRSIFYAQLAERLSKDITTQARILPKSAEASSSPTVEVAAKLAAEAKTPLLVLHDWINMAEFTPSVDNNNLLTVLNLKNNTVLPAEKKPEFSIQNGRLTCNGQLITGGKTDVQWWSGKTKPQYLSRMKPHVTRFVPGREGLGLTDRINSVIAFMKANNIAVLDHNYGLWYDRRRDDHQRVRRADGDTWAPFYEQPFARSGQGTAWDGLSKYDLYRPNLWYWSRLKEFADKAEHNGLLLFHQHFFQHNIIEAGAHWVDCPWRTANNINETGFPEPVNFAGDKRVFMADIFYDLSNENRRNAYRNYIRQSLNAFANNKNVVQFLSNEYTGPLHFVEFWLDVIAEWQAETGNDALIALSATKDVQDAILNDPARSAVVDIIDIRYWHYKNDGSVYAPQGGLSLAPRQHERLKPAGKVTFTEAYKAVADYRARFPEKAVTYYARNYPDMAWSVLMAGGSCPVLEITDTDFHKAVLAMNIKQLENTDYTMLEKSGTGVIIFSHSANDIQVELEPGNYELKYINHKTGDATILSKNIHGRKTYHLRIITGKEGAYWFRKKI